MGIKRPEPAAVELYIDELVLHGFPSTDRFGIADAVQQELTRLLAAGGVPALPSADAGHLDAGTFTVTPGARPRAVGTQLARSLHRRLSSPESAAPRDAHSAPARRTR